jgi:integrase
MLDRAEGTKINYANALAGFKRFVEECGVPGLSVAAARNFQLADFIRSNRFGSVPAVVAALDHCIGRLKGDEREVQQSLVAMAAKQRVPTQHRIKVTEKHWKLLLETALASSEPRIRVAGKAVFLLFKALLRISELVQVRASDIVVEEEFISLTIRKSKTDQEGKGATVAFALNSDVEQRVWDREFKEFVGLEFFIFGSLSTRKPLTTSTMRRYLDALLAEAGLQECHYTTHSFRGGAATAAIRHGVQQSEVMRAGRWKTTEAFNAYLRPIPLP